MELSKLTTAELDQLLAEAADERGRRVNAGDAHPTEPSQHSAMAVFNPQWRANAVNSKMLFRFCHACYGWVDVAWDSQSFAELYGYFSRIVALGAMSAAAEVKQDESPGAPTAASGGAIH